MWNLVPKIKHTWRTGSTEFDRRPSIGLHHSRLVRSCPISIKQSPWCRLWCFTLLAPEMLFSQLNDLCNTWNLERCRILHQIFVSLAHDLWVTHPREEARLEQRITYLHTIYRRLVCDDFGYVEESITWSWQWRFQGPRACVIRRVPSYWWETRRWRRMVGR